MDRRFIHRPCLLLASIANAQLMQTSIYVNCRTVPKDNPELLNAVGNPVPCFIILRKVFE